MAAAGGGEGGLGAGAGSACSPVRSGSSNSEYRSCLCDGEGGGARAGVRHSVGTQGGVDWSAGRDSPRCLSFL